MNQSDENESKAQQKSIKFDLLQDQSQSQKELCYAISINKEQNLVLVGCHNQIKVFAFDDKGQLTEKQRLDGHSSYIFCIQFFQTQRKFLSGGLDGFIKIWIQDENDQWIIQEVLEGSVNKQISSVQLNCLEDTLINGNGDGTIKFWNQQSQKWKCIQNLCVHKDIIWSLSLNPSETKLISCGNDELVCVFQYHHSEWQIVQQISKTYGNRICFINDNVFTFQPWKENLLQIFELVHGQFQLVNEIKIENRSEWFSGGQYPQQYLKGKKILFTKYGESLNLIKIIEGKQFHYLCSINFQTNRVFGRTSEDGNYLITWDFRSKQIQVRRIVHIDL